LRRWFNQGDAPLKKVILASACILALSVGGAFAQSQPAPGASSEGNVGPGATKSHTNMKKGTTTGAGGGMTNSGMTGSKSMGNTSSEGNVGPGTNNNSGKQPGGR
jgi:hypothetical protein